MKYNGEETANNTKTDAAVKLHIMIDNRYQKVSSVIFYCLMV